MFFKKKVRLTVSERTPDTVPFKIPRIGEEEVYGYKKDHFVSPIFGTKVKDDIIIPTPHERQGDLDLQFDSFRTVPKLSAEDKKRKYGSEYHEFDTVSGNNLNEALARQNQRTKKQMDEDVDLPIIVERKPEPRVFEPIPLDEFTITPKKTSISDFVEKEEVKTERTDIKITLKPQVESRPNSDYQLPPYSLLNKPAEKRNEGNEWIQNHIDVLNRTFEEFKVGASVYKYTKGPTVTRYEVILESGVNVKKITNLSDNLKMALAAKEIRIEAPIPGKSTVGIEVPNKVAEIVTFSEIVNKEEFKRADDPLTIALGLDIDGKAVYTSISKMPHGLVAGATGSGKSVCINTVLMSLLFKYSPDELKLMLIDPKMVELTSYNDLPHLLTPVITDAKIATAGLKWAVEEMERRFVMFSKERVRDIKSYNEKIEEEGNSDIMPFIVIIVDELADLMMIASSSVEESIMRLTQKARACGIHLIIATQRPSTDVIKGTIKSNIPTRIAFMVSSYIDSMTIIDSAGADKLLGRGDMLFAEAGQNQIRIQGAYISDNEIHNVNEFIRRQRDPEFFFSQERLVKNVAQSDNYDELMSEVASYVVVQGECSINKISKEFKIGFNRAQKIVEMLADHQIVSDNQGSKARSVLVTMEELEMILNGW